MDTEEIPIEDFYEDILGKSMRGQGVGADELCAKTGADLDTLQRMLNGEADEATTRLVAPVLGLGTEQLLLAAKKTWRPEPVDLAGLRTFNTIYKDMRVNAYLLWNPGQADACLFDTGTDAAPILAAADELGLCISNIFLTHTHSDHIAALPELLEALDSPLVHISEQEPHLGAKLFQAGDQFATSGLNIATRSTWGHSPGGTTYVVEGLARPLAVVGDAVFAGSMGGCAVSYPDGLRTNREEIMTLPKETILCPGHGPLTTVGEEARHNPFFAITD